MKALLEVVRRRIEIHPVCAFVRERVTFCGFDRFKQGYDC